MRFLVLVWVTLLIFSSGHCAMAKTSVSFTQAGAQADVAIDDQAGTDATVLFRLLNIQAEPQGGELIKEAHEADHSFGLRCASAYRSSGCLLTILKSNASSINPATGRVTYEITGRIAAQWFDLLYQGDVGHSRYETQDRKLVIDAFPDQLRVEYWGF